MTARFVQLVAQLLDSALKRIRPRSPLPRSSDAEGERTGNALPWHRAHALDIGACSTRCGTQVQQFAQQAGIGGKEASAALAGLLPGLVDKLSPDGKLPDAKGIESMIGKLIGS